MDNLKSYSDINRMEYIVSLPSGLVIDMKKIDIIKLFRMKLVKINLKIQKFYCSDADVDRIYELLNKNKELNNKQEISSFLIDCGLLTDQFTIYDDLSVDVYGPINMSYKHLFKIPFKFNRTTSNFDCSFNNLSTLENSPKIVHGYFNCSYNFLKNLHGGPKHVSKGYNCSNNNLLDRNFKHSKKP